MSSDSEPVSKVSGDALLDMGSEEVRAEDVSEGETLESDSLTEDKTVHHQLDIDRSRTIRTNDIQEEANQREKLGGNDESAELGLEQNAARSEQEKDNVSDDGSHQNRDDADDKKAGSKRPQSDEIPPDFTVKRQTTRRRVPGKVVTDLWQFLDQSSLESMNRILFIALNKATEKYFTSTRQKKSKKLEEAQRIITKSWISKGDSSSFNARLGVTKFPPKMTMGLTKKKEDFNFLSYDHVMRRKAYLETCLSAELSQLGDLQKHYNELNILYESDLKYLKSFKKTKDIHDAKLEKEMQKKSEELGLNLKDLPLAQAGENHQAPTPLFDPTTDPDTKTMLQELDIHFTAQSENTAKLSEINNRLESLYNKLDML